MFPWEWRGKLRAKPAGVRWQRHDQRRSKFSQVRTDHEITRPTPADRRSAGVNRASQAENFALATQGPPPEGARGRRYRQQADSAAPGQRLARQAAQRLMEQQ